MERYRQLLKLKRCMNSDILSNFATEEKMSDWDDDETTTGTTGRSFGQNNYDNDFNNEDNDDENGGRFNNGRGAGRGRGRGGSGGGRSYRPFNDGNKEGNGFQRRGGRFNRENGDDEDNGANRSIVSNDEFSKIPLIIPQDYKQETIEKFIKDLPKLQKAANLIEMYCIDSYLTRAYNIHLNAALEEDNQFPKIGSKKQKDSTLPTMTDETVERFQIPIEDQRKRNAEIQTKQREEFMHNLKVAGREKEAELSPRRRALIQEQKLELNEKFWRKKFEGEPGLRKMLERHCELQENRRHQGFGNLLSELQSDNYEITASDLEQADRRRVRLTGDSDRQQQMATPSRNDKHQQYRMPSRLFSRNEEPQSLMTPQCSSAKRRYEDQRTRRKEPLNSISDPMLQLPQRYFQNLPEDFMRLRLPYKTLTLQPILTTNKSVSSMITTMRRPKKPIAYYSAENIFFRNCRNTSQHFEELSSIGDVRRNATPSSGSGSLQVPLGGTSTTQEPVTHSMGPTYSPVLIDLPMHQTERESMNSDQHAQLFMEDVLAAESTPMEPRRLPLNIDPIDISPVSFLDRRSVSFKEPTTIAKRGDISRLTAISERRTESVGIDAYNEPLENYQVSPPFTENVVGSDNLPPNLNAIGQIDEALNVDAIAENNELLMSDVTLSRQQAVLANAEISVHETSPRDWHAILRSQNVQVNYAITGHHQRSRRPRRRRHRSVPRSRPLNREESLSTLADNFPILPSPPIRFNGEEVVFDQQPLPSSPIIEPDLVHNYQESEEILQSAQALHEQFLIDNIDSVNVIVDNSQVYHKMMVEYMQAYQERDVNSFNDGLLLSGMSYDIKSILEINPRELEVKLYVIEELLKNPYINLHRLSGIKNREEMAIAIGLLMDLNGNNMVEIQGNAEKVLLK